MKHIFYTFALVFFIAGCGNAPQPPIQLNDLSNDISVKKLGERLIDLPYGLNELEPREEEAQEIFIAVHGGSSEGYEWIYPIKKIDTKQKHMYFYRWPDNGCFQSSAEELANQINNLLNQNDSFKKSNINRSQLWWHTRYSCFKALECSHSIGGACCCCSFIRHTNA